MDRLHAPHRALRRLPPLRGLTRWLSHLRLLALLVAAMAAPARAQSPGEAPATNEAWVVSYALVILCVGLGIFIISRNARREGKG